MDDNVVLVGFTDQSRAYQALSRLGQADDTGMVEVRSAALLERGPDGVVRVPEGADTASGDAVAGGGLIGPVGRGARRAAGHAAGHVHRHACRRRRSGGSRR